jgi:hypothetical protein
LQYYLAVYNIHWVLAAAAIDLFWYSRLVFRALRSKENRVCCLFPGQWSGQWSGLVILGRSEIEQGLLDSPVTVEIIRNLNNLYEESVRLTQGK